MTFRLVPWAMACSLAGLLTSCLPSGGSPLQPSAATPTPTASPVPTPGPLRAVSIKVTPATADLYVAPPRGMTPQHPYTIQLEAEVTYSDGSIDEDDVEWASLEGDRARVDQTGLVTAGIETGEVVIRVESEDGQASASLVITVKDDSAAEVTVD